jgi:serine/threonine-protein kinase
MFSIGDTVAGKYRIERLLGEGGMGAVFAAEHLLLEQRVAIKVISAHLSGGAARERFLREARAAARVRSEHVTQVLDVGEEPDGTIFMVLEFLEGKNLAELLEERGTLPIDEAVALALEGLIGVAAAHAAGIVHRDLKLENLFVARRQNGSRCVKVLDFGISKSLGESKNLTASGAMVGSPYSMSPEQIRDAKSVDARTDVWSMGIVTYALLTGGSPFVAEDVGGVLAAILERTPPPLEDSRPGAPIGLNVTLQRALAKDRAQRFSSVVDLADSLSPYAGLRGAALASEVRRALGQGAVDTVAPDSKAEPRAASHKSLAFAETTESRPGIQSGEAVAVTPGGPASVARKSQPGQPIPRIDASVAGVPFERPRRSTPFLWIGVTAGALIAIALALGLGQRTSPQPATSAQEAKATPIVTSPATAAVASIAPTATLAPPAPTPSVSTVVVSADSASAQAPGLHGKLPTVSPGATAPPPRASAAPNAPAPPPTATTPPVQTNKPPPGDDLFNQGRM